MILYICGHDFHYEMENLCRVFFPNEKITVSDTLPESGAPEVETYLDGASGGYSVRVRVNVGAILPYPYRAYMPREANLHLPQRNSSLRYSSL